MSNQNPKHAIFELLAATARALGSAHRLAIPGLLAQTACSVEELASLSSLTIANASQRAWHLKANDPRSQAEPHARALRELDSTARRICSGRSRAFGQCSSVNPPQKPVEQRRANGEPCCQAGSPALTIEWGEFV